VSTTTEHGPGDCTTLLLQQWHRGSRTALDELLRRNLPWLMRRVHRSLGERLRRKTETADIVQEAALDLLEYGPRFALSSEAQLRALLGRIAENVLRGQHDWFRARRRSVDRERRLAPASLDGLAAYCTADQPSEVAERRETGAWVQRAVELLAPRDRDALYLRHWHGLSFRELGERLGITEDSARMRFTRALRRLGDTLRGSTGGLANVA
jgi:RNA polymerase sigma-70 factor (ECF subfamily)